MKKIIYSVFLLASSSLYSQQQNCGIPPGEKLKTYYYEYSSGMDFAMDVITARSMPEVMTQRDQTSNTAPSDLASALQEMDYADLGISEEFHEGNCQSRAVYYLSVTKYPSSDCGLATRDLFFGVKGFKEDAAHGGPDCKGEHGNWFMSFTIPSNVLFPNFILYRVGE